MAASEFLCGSFLSFHHTLLLLLSYRLAPPLFHTHIRSKHMNIKEQAVETVIAKQKRDCSRKYLNDIRKMNIRLDLAEKAAQRGYESLEPSGIAYDRVNVTTTPTGDKLERGVIRLIEEKEDADAFVTAVAPAVEDAKSIIRTLDDPEERYVLFARYFHGTIPVDFRQLASELGYEVRTVYRRHDSALEHLYDMIPGEYRMTADTNAFLQEQLEEARYA